MLPQTILFLVLLNLFSQVANLGQEIKTKIIQKHHWYWRRVIAICILILKQPSRYSSHTVVLDRNNVFRSMWFSFSFAITYKFKHITETTLMFPLLPLNSSLCGKKSSISRSDLIRYFITRYPRKTYNGILTSVMEITNQSVLTLTK